MTDARAVALDVLLRVDADEAWADRALAAAAARAGLDARDRALAARLAAGTVKGRRLLDAAVLALADRDPAKLDPVSRAVVRLGACQLLLLDRVPDPDETTVRFALAGNLCRCTGYDKIIRAVMDAAASMRATPGAHA